VSLDGDISRPLGDLGHLGDDGVEPLDMAHTNHQFRAFNDLKKPGALFCSQGDGLFNKAVYARLDHLFRHLEVISGGNADADRIHLLQQLLRRGAYAGILPSSCRIFRQGIIDINRVHSLQLGVNPHMVPPHGSYANYSHVHIQASKEFMISAMYCRSSAVSEGCTGRLNTRRETSSATGQETSV